MTQAAVEVRHIVSRSGFANPLTLGVLVSAETYVKVYADDTLLVQGTHYTITGIGDLAGVSIEIIGANDVNNYVGYVTFTAIYDPPLDQQSDLSAGGVLGRAFETALDQQDRLIQAVDGRVDRAIKVPVNIDGDMVLPTPAPYEVILWNADGNGFITLPINYGDAGVTSVVGPGVPAGGASGRFLRKSSAVDYATEWHAIAAADITFNPTGAVVATTVQTAIAELDTDLTAEIAARVAAVAAVTPTSLGLVIGTNVQAYDADLSTFGAFGMTAFSGLLYGLTVSNNGTDATNDIDFAAGVCVDSTNLKLQNCAAMTKRLDANWAAGTNQGMRYSGAAIANTTYHLYVATKADGTQDYYADPSAVIATVLAHLQAETGGSAYLYLRRIASIVRTGAAIKAFTQIGDRFAWAVCASDVSANTTGTSAVTATLTVPVGIVVNAEVAASLRDDSTASGDVYALLTPLTATDTSPSATANSLSVLGVTDVGGASNTYTQLAVNASGQIRYRLNISQADITISVQTIGYIDTRGRLA